jgi:hypothetical protein
LGRGGMENIIGWPMNWRKDERNGSKDSGD